LERGEPDVRPHQPEDGEERPTLIAIDRLDGTTTFDRSKAILSPSLTPQAESRWIDAETIAHFHDRHAAPHAPPQIHKRRDADATLSLTPATLPSRPALP
jgi:hypothetical protein